MNTGQTYGSNYIDPDKYGIIMNTDKGHSTERDTTNQTLLDPTLYDGLITLNSDDIPLEVISRYKSDSQLIAPQGYITAYIAVMRNGLIEYTLPMLFPGDLVENWSTNFVKENPVGSEFPITAFSNTATTQVTLNFTALQEYLPTNFKTLKDYLNAVRQMVKPKYSGNEVQAPSVFVSLAGVIFSAVCDSLTISYKQNYGIDAYLHADISCTFSLLSYNEKVQEVVSNSTYEEGEDGEYNFIITDVFGTIGGK